MLNKDINFAHYSQILCTIIATLSLGVSILTFTSGVDNAVLLGFLWLALAGVFCLCAWFVGTQQDFGDTVTPPAASTDTQAAEQAESEG